MKFENDLSKLARWAIPGWIAILSFYAFVATHILSTPDNDVSLYEGVSKFLNDMFTIDIALSAILVAASGVPIGFVVYQVYFFFRWNSPFSKDGLFLSFFPGRLADLERSIRDISLEELSKHPERPEWRKKWITHPLYQIDHRYKWSYIELLFTEAAQKIDSTYPGLSIYGRHRYLHEVTHTIGASIAAVYIGFAGYIFLLIQKKWQHIPGHLLTAILLLGVLFFLINQEERARQRFASKKPSDIRSSGSTGQSLISTFSFNLDFFNKKICFSFNTPSTFLLFTLALFHLFGNPKFNPSTDLRETLIRVILAIMILIFLFLSKRAPQKDEKWGDFALASLIIFLSLFIRWKYSFFENFFDWAYLIVIFEFLLLNLVLFQNRENSREEVTALEYYTLRRYLTEHDCKEESKRNPSSSSVSFY